MPHEPSYRAQQACQEIDQRATDLEVLVRRHLGTGAEAKANISAIRQTAQQVKKAIITAEQAEPQKK